MLPVAFTVLLLAASPPRLFLPGPMPASQVPAEGTRALALCGNELREVEIRVRPGATPDTERLEVPCDAVALFAQVLNLRPGPVAEARLHRSATARSSPFGPLRIDLQLGRHRERVTRIRLGSTGYRLVLSGAGIGAPVVLYEAQSTDRAFWDLLWAGDLDQDGEIDLLLQASDAQDLRELHLFLSRGATEAVDEAAWLQQKLTR